MQHQKLVLQFFDVKLIFSKLTAVLQKLFDIRFPYKNCNFTCGCLLSRWPPKPWWGLYTLSGSYNVVLKNRGITFIIVTLSVISWHAWTTYYSALKAWYTDCAPVVDKYCILYKIKTGLWKLWGLRKIVILTHIIEE